MKLSFFKQVEILADEQARSGALFHRTRRPFTRLQDILGQIREGRGKSHPAVCHKSECQKPIRERYFQRADGYVLCEQCYDAL